MQIVDYEQAQRLGIAAHQIGQQGQQLQLMRVLAPQPMPVPPRVVGHAHHLVHEGRVGGVGGRVHAKLGAVPQNSPAGEIYQALEKGTIDAAEWIGPYDDLRLGLHKVAQNYYYPAWWEGSTQFSLYINDKQWNGLSPEYKAIVFQATAADHVGCQARYDALNPNALKQLVAEGAKLSRFPKDFMDAAFKASREVYAELNEKNPNWKKIYPDFSRFLAEQVQWESVAESNYSQYMASQKL